MITIGLDEYGHFQIDSSQVSFVGGYLFTGDDVDNERLSLYEFLEKTCDTMGIRFPQDLHLDRDGSNRNAVRYFEEHIEEPLYEYFKERRNYHIVLMIKSNRPRKDYSNISNLVDDSKANNLYEHMICGLLHNLLFSNLDLQHEKNVRLEIPTRVSVIPEEDKDKVQEFIDLGYPYKVINRKGELRYQFYSTDQKTIKTALSSMLMDYSRKKDTIFDSLHIESIDYENRNENMAFLYLADIVCNMLKRRVKGYKNDFGIQEIEKWAKEYTGNVPYFWAYDDIDSIYNNMMEKFFSGEFIKLQMDLFDARNHNGDFTSYYNSSWFSMIEEKIDMCFDISKIGLYISQLEHHYMQGDIKNEKGIQAIDGLWSMINKNQNIIKDTVKYQAADIGLRAYNHRGSTELTNPYYLICEELKFKVPIEQYLDTVTRQIQIDVNAFDFDKAIKKGTYNLECLDILKKAREDIALLNESYTSTSVHSIARGRALSSLGQFYAFKKEKNALEYFEEALEEFKEDKDNYQITLSHLLNFASDQKNHQLFNTYMKEYFGDDDLETIFHKIIEENKMSFMLYTFQKALNCLFIEKVDESLLRKIKTTDYENKGFATEQHPWELIYKNIGIILYEKKEPKTATKYMKKAVETIKSPNETIVAINYFTKIQDSFYQGDMRKLQNLENGFKKWLEDSFRLKMYFEDAFVDNPIETYKNLCNKFTYTYM